MLQESRSPGFCRLTFGVLIGFLAAVMPLSVACAGKPGGGMDGTKVAGAHEKHRNDLRFEASRQETLTAVGSRLVLDNDTGDVTLRADPSARAMTAQVRVKAKGKTQAEADALLARIAATMAASAKPGEVLAKGDLPEHLTNSWGEVSWVITVPAECALQINTGMGDVHAEGSRGGATLESGMGDVVAEAFSGALDAKTGMGDVEANGEGPMKLTTGMGTISVRATGTDPISADTGMGDVELTVADGFKARVNATTGMGEVEFIGGVTVSAGKSNGGRRRESGPSGSFQGDIGGPGGPDIRLSSGTGDIRIQAGAQPD